VLHAAHAGDQQLGQQGAHGTIGAQAAALESGAGAVDATHGRAGAALLRAAAMGGALIGGAHRGHGVDGGEAALARWARIGELVAEPCAGRDAGQARLSALRQLLGGVWSPEREAIERLVA
jgi:hypothetical protein